MRYRMDGGSIVDTDKAAESWEERTDWDGHNHISRNTRSQWEHETLYRSRKGRYYIVHDSQWQGSMPSAEWVSNKQAAAWLLLNDRPLPEDLAEVAAEIEE